MNTQLHSGPEVSIHVWGGMKRLAVNIVLRNFDDAQGKNGLSLVDNYRERLRLYLWHLHELKDAAAPNRTMALILQHWTAGSGFDIKLTEHGLKLRMHPPCLPEPELSTGIWRSLLRDDIKQVIDDFNHTYVPEFYDGTVSVYNYIRHRTERSLVL